MTAMAADNREALWRFAVSVYPDAEKLEKLAGDAGAREYYRLLPQNVILMDGRTEREAAARFAGRTAQFAACGLPVPEILADNGEGLLLLQDFGDDTLDKWLASDTGARMPAVLELLGQWQEKTAGLAGELPPYSREILREELSRFELWFWPEFFGAQTGDEKAGFEADAKALMDIIQAQPVRAVHRDFHSRNLLALPAGGIGIIDYQDALRGAAQYDLVSLTRDCYRRYDDSARMAWEEVFRSRFYPEIAAADWQRACHAVSLQRHIKVLGLFVRLSVQAGKTRYLADLPRVWDYALFESEALAGELPFTARFLQKKQTQVQSAFHERRLA